MKTLFKLNREDKEYNQQTATTRKAKVAVQRSEDKFVVTQSSVLTNINLSKIPTLTFSSIFDLSSKQENVIWNKSVPLIKSIEIN